MIHQIIVWTCFFSIALAAPASVVPLPKNTDAALPNTTDWLENGLFEGDLKLSKEFILDHYNFSSVPGGEKIRDLLIGVDDASKRIERRGVGKEGAINLWANGTVRYQISSGISNSTAALIRGAMNHWENHTCLTFVAASSGDYIDFVNTDSGCYSTDIGRRGGRQVINLQSPWCETLGIIVHEIGHAIGFWHEQSRPDRDRYVSILLGNIRSGRASQFMKKNNNEVDSLGSTYDYGSIMHYTSTAFKTPGCSGSGCTTILVNNQAEYNRQGRPRLGQRIALSTEDINQANLLYSCSNSSDGSSTNLQVYIRYARNLRDTDPLFNDPDPYVRVQAKGSSGSAVTLYSEVKGGTTNPTWNQLLNFGCQGWNSFEMQIWDDDNFLTFGDDEMSNKEVVSVSPGNHSNLRHNAHGSGYLVYNYTLIEDANDCIPNRCQNGGTCVDQCSSYRCSCQQGYAGTNCEYRAGNLQVKARYGRNLPDKDGWWNNSDPYMEFIAVDIFGKSHRLTTSVKSGTHYPTWNQSLNFGYRAWTYLQVRVYDSDRGPDDAMSNRVTYKLKSPDYSRVGVSHICYRGNTVFDFSYTN